MIPGSEEDEGVGAFRFFFKHDQRHSRMTVVVLDG